MVTRRIAIGAAALLAAAAFGIAAGPARAVHAANNGGCELSGSATLTPGLTTSSQTFSYSFSGALTPCSSTGQPSGVTGTVFAGVDPSGNKETTGYPSGSGSCGSSTTSGIAVAQFSDGSTAVIQYSTTGAGPAVALQGTVIGSVTFGLVTYTTSAEWAGDSAYAPLTFQPASGQNCVTTPVTTAVINGPTLLGSA